MLLTMPIVPSFGVRPSPRRATALQPSRQPEPETYAELLRDSYKFLAEHPLPAEEPMAVTRPVARPPAAPVAQLPVDAVAVTILANSGGAIPNDAGGPPIVPDLATLVCAVPAPILFNHGERLGYASFVSTADGGVLAKGHLFTRHAAAKRVIDDARAGFKWQASVYIEANPDKVLRSPGGPFSYRGRTIHAPHLVAVGARLIEISIVERGADPATCIRIG